VLPYVIGQKYHTLPSGSAYAPLHLLHKIDVSAHLEARVTIFYDVASASESLVQNSPVFAACSPEIEMDA